MSELTPASNRRALDAGPAPESFPVHGPGLLHTRLDCQGCPVAAGEVPDASCAECVVSVFLAAEPWPADGA